MGEQREVEGPDLGEGIALSALVEGEPVAGHRDGEPVLVVRLGSEVHAVGGACTHYGGPLGEGLVVDGTVRCPWHHACFSLRTGEALAAPALNPLPRWEVEVRDGLVGVGRKQEQDPLASHGRRATAGGPMVILGAGAAGSAAAEMLRREGYEGEVVLIDPDDDAPYDRPNLSKDYLAGNAPEEWIPLRPADFYAQHGMERLNVAVEPLRNFQRAVADLPVIGAVNGAFDRSRLAAGSATLIATERRRAMSASIVCGVDGSADAQVVFGDGVSDAIAFRLNLHSGVPESLLDGID